MPLLPTLWRQRQVDIHEFKACIFFIASFRITRAAQKYPQLEKNKRSMSLSLVHRKHLTIIHFFSSSSILSSFLMCPCMSTHYCPLSVTLVQCRQSLIANSSYSWVFWPSLASASPWSCLGLGTKVFWCCFPEQSHHQLCIKPNCILKQLSHLGKTNKQTNK